MIGIWINPTANIYIYTYIAYIYISHMQYIVQTRKLSLNHVELNQIWFVITIFRLIWHYKWDSASMIVWSKNLVQIYQNILYLKYILSIKNKNFRWKMENFRFFFLFTSKVHQFCEFRWLHQKNHIKIYQTTSSFYYNFCFKLIKNRLILVKKWEIQIIVFLTKISHHMSKHDSS